MDGQKWVDHSQASCVCVVASHRWIGTSRCRLNFCLFSVFTTSPPSTSALLRPTQAAVVAVAPHPSSRLQCGDGAGGLVIADRFALDMAFIRHNRLPPGRNRRSGAGATCALVSSLPTVLNHSKRKDQQPQLCPTQSIDSAFLVSAISPSHSQAKDQKHAILRLREELNCSSSSKAHS